MHEKPDILRNYTHDRHFLQNVHLSRDKTSKRPFIYMKNHKAACTTILATLIHHQMEYLDLPPGPITGNTIHSPPKILIRNGRRSLSVEDACRALETPRVYKFTVIREPLSRILSAFSDKVTGDTKQRAALFRHAGLSMDHELKLEDFIDIVTQDSVARNLDRHWRSQRKEISYGQINYDYIGTVENLGPALRVILREVFATADMNLQDTRKTIGHKSKSESLRDGLSKKDLGKLEQAYSDDFEMYATIAGKAA